MKKLYIVAFSLGLCAAGLVAAGVVQSFKVNGSDVYSLSDTGVLTLSGSVSVPAVAVTGSSGFSITRSASDPITGTASAAGIIMISSASVVYVSTGTTGNAWVKVGAQ